MFWEEIFRSGRLGLVITMSPPQKKKRNKKSLSFYIWILTSVLFELLYHITIIQKNFSNSQNTFPCKIFFFKLLVYNCPTIMFLKYIYWEYGRGLHWVVKLVATDTMCYCRAIVGQNKYLNIIYRTWVAIQKTRKSGQPPNPAKAVLKIRSSSIQS